MRFKTVLSTLALAASLGLAGPAIAQDHMIGGQAVPADQVPAIQAKCDELRAAATGGAATTTEAPAADAAAPAADAAAPAADAAAPAAPAADAAAQIDLETLTVAQCDEGGFAASAM